VGPWYRFHLGALLAHLILALFFTWPLALNLLPGSGTLVPGVMLEDRDQNLWNLWWVRDALFRGHNPFVTDMLYWPTPVSLYFHTLNIFNGLLAVPLLSVFSLTTTYNIIVLFSFVVAGYVAFLVVHYVCGNRWAALVGSVVFAYSAYHIATMRSLLQLISLEWIPFFVLFLLKAVYELDWNTRRAFVNWLLRRALPAAIFLLLISLVDWYYTMYALMFAGFLAIYLLTAAVRQGLTTRITHYALRIALPLAIYGLLVSPILIPMYRELRTTTYMQPTSTAAMENSADLLTFFQPTRDQRLWGGLFKNRREWPYGSNRYEVYATYTALFLAGVGLFATRAARPVVVDDAMAVMPEATNPEDQEPNLLRTPTKWFWAGTALVFFLLALGPVLQVNGEQIRGVPMPYAIVSYIPVLNISRSPDRFDMPFTLCLAVLAGYGVNVLLGIWGKRLSLASRGAFLSLGTIAVIALELAPMPYPQRVADIADGYKWLGAQQGDFSVLDLPPQDDYWHGAFRMYNQTAHGKPIYGGYISREFPHPFLQSTPGYQELTYVDGAGDIFAAGPDQWYSAFAQYKLGYIALQKDRLPNYPDNDARDQADSATSRQAIIKVLGSAATPVFSDTQLEIYPVPGPRERVPFLSVSDGWEPREMNETGDTYRWMGQEATLRIDAPRTENAFLTFRAGSLGGPRQLQIYHGDTLVFDATIQPGITEYRTKGPLGLPQGVSRLRFVSPTGTTSPADLGQGDDPRRLSFVLMSVGLEPSK
jgi:hypothetical protein